MGAELELMMIFHWADETLCLIVDELASYIASRTFDAAVSQALIGDTQMWSMNAHDVDQPKGCIGSQMLVMQ